MASTFLIGGRCVPARGGRGLQQQLPLHRELNVVLMDEPPGAEGPVGDD